MTTTLQAPTPSASISDTPTLKRWTVQDYHRLGDLGILAPEERTELIAGQIILMASKGTPHVLSLRLLSQTLDALFAEHPVFISLQDPIQLDDFSEPEPDVAIVRGRILDYADHHPTAQDVDWIIEVADSTLSYDTGTKAQLYAQSGIPDYWVLDLKNRQFHIFRNPTPTGYSSHLILAEPNQASPLAFPQVSLDLTASLPPLLG